MIYFRFSLEKEIENYKKGKEYAQGTKFLSKYKEKFGDNFSGENIQEFSSIVFNDFKTSPDKELKKIKESFLQIEKDVFERLENIFKVKSPERVDVYLTTFNRCTYNLQQNYFFVSILGNNPNLNIVHELIHIFTYLRFGDGEYIAKEALTELINLEFLDLVKQKDLGKPGHEAKREIVKRVWSQTKDIQSVWDAIK